jgi:tetratricopeptide (TPR) repeat protein
MAVSGELWSINLIGKFEVRRPDGKPLRFRTRKAEALVALLALHDGRAVSRQELAEALWPGADRNNQQTNLRQALSIARSAFDDNGAIEADRAGCRLNVSGWTCDAIEVFEGRASSAGGALLPAMTEDVFNTWRMEFAQGHLETLEHPAVAALPALLDWAMSVDPSRILEIAHATPELVSALPLSKWERVLGTAVEASKSTHPLFPWGNLQLANVLMWQGKSAEALTYAKVAIGRAEMQGDSHTLTGALFVAAYLLTMQGRWSRAVDLIESGRKAIDERRDVFHGRRLDHALGHVHAHRGDIRTALQAMVRNHISEPEFSEETAWAFRTIHQSCYLALLGKPQEAWSEYESALTVAKRLCHPLLDTQVLLAKANTLLAENKKEQAIEIFKGLEVQGSKIGTMPTVICAIEGIALATEDPIERANRFTQADLLRREHNLPLLPIDRLRLQQADRVV